MDEIKKYEKRDGYTARRLRDYRQFYLSFKDIQIWHSQVPNLIWTHFRIIMRKATPERAKLIEQQKRFFLEQHSKER